MRCVLAASSDNSNCFFYGNLSSFNETESEIMLSNPIVLYVKTFNIKFSELKIDEIENNVYCISASSCMSENLVVKKVIEIIDVSEDFKLFMQDKVEKMRDLIKSYWGDL